jgi:hypothetical protein
MNRRRFLAAGTATLGATLGLAGCIGGIGGGSGSAAPPRESEVFQSIRAKQKALVVQLEQSPVVTSRADIGGNQNNMRQPPSDGVLGALAPVGVASAGGRGGRGGRGASGRGRGGSGNVPSGRNGRNKYHGGSYSAWHNDHDDEVEEYRCQISRCGVGYLGSDAEYSDDPPGVGAVEWDETFPSPQQAMRYSNLQRGWYRVGAKLTSMNGNHNFGWEAVDFQMMSEGTGYNVANQWKISPRL